MGQPAASAWGDARQLLRRLHVAPAIHRRAAYWELPRDGGMRPDAFQLLLLGLLGVIQIPA